MKTFFSTIFAVALVVILATPTSAQQVLSSAHSVYFGNGSTVLTNKTTTTLDELISRLKKGTEYEVLVYGYASKDGGTKANLELSAARTKSVYSYFIDAGIPSDKVRMRIPRGEEQPRSLWYKGEPVPTGEKARFVEIVITPKIDLVDPSGAPQGN
jgi:outer membrane protein OmpA-like peptidoglycan-associated protein